MKIGVRYPGMAGELGFEGLCAWLKENGFEALDTPPLDKDMKKAMEAAGLALGTVDMDFGAVGKALSADKAKRREGVAAIKKGMTRAASLGAHTIFTCLIPEDYSKSRAENFEYFKLSFPDVVGHAESLNLNIAIEPYPGPGPTYPALGCTPEMWRAIFEFLPSPNLGICFDPSHLVRMHIDYLRALHEFADRVRHVHAKDTEINAEHLYETGIFGLTFGKAYICGDRWWRYAIPGDGCVDWRTVVLRLMDAGYDGCLCIELEDHNYYPEVEKQKAGLLASKCQLEKALRR
ncbi:MAG: sugar phosphate isomerase/epimerase [Armatimonadetes bacterium]|nr:sugar phosphate isomerase/epimerase [Armatimonadota bacterium]